MYLYCICIVFVFVFVPLHCLLAAPQQSTTTCSTVSASLWNYMRWFLLTEIDGESLFSGSKNPVRTGDGLCGLHMGHDQGYRPGKGRILLFSTLWTYLHPTPCIPTRALKLLVNKPTWNKQKKLLIFLSMNKTLVHKLKLSHLNKEIVQV